MAAGLESPEGSAGTQVAGHRCCLWAATAPGIFDQRTRMWSLMMLASQGVTVRFREGVFQGQAFQEMRSRSCQDTQGLCREPVQAHSASLCWSQQSPGPSSFKEWGRVGEKCSPPLDEGVSGKVTWRSTWHTAPLFFLSTSWTVPSSFPSSPAACPQCLCWTSHRPRLCTLQLCKAWALLFLPVYSFFLDLLMQLCDSEGRVSVWAWGRSNRGLIRFPHL